MVIELLGRAFFLMPALVLILSVGYIAVQHQRLFLAIFMLLSALDGTRDFAPDFEMTISEISVYPPDLFFVVATVSGLARIGKWRLRGIALTSVLMLTLLVSSGLIIWSFTYTVPVAVNFWRDDLLILALLLYATTRPRPWSWKDLQAIIVAPAIVVALASLVGILFYGFGSSSSSVEISGAIEGGRPANASGSLIMLVGIWVTGLAIEKWTARRTVTILLLGVMLLLAQNRSVWVAAILSVAVWWLAPRISSRGAGSLRAANRTIVVFSVAAAAGLVGSSVSALGESASDNHTWVWRIARWVDSMSIPRSWVEWLAGSAVGPTPAAKAGLFPSHSLYVTTIEQTGFIGLGALLVLILCVGKARFPSPTNLIGPIVACIALAYGVAYLLNPWIWMLVGILLASNAMVRHEVRANSLGDFLTDLKDPKDPMEHWVNGHIR